MTEELEQLLKNLKLRRMLEIYDEQLRAADKDDISYSEFVTRLVRAQFQAKQEGAIAAERKKMVGSGDRSEKIRTYNFPQSRITDHRIGFTTHRLQDVLDGNLDELVEPISSYFQAERLKDELARA